MCYSGMCRFEDEMGNCEIGVGFKEFKDKYGFNSCTVGGYGHDNPEEEKFYNEHEEEIEVSYKRFLEDVKNKRNRWSWIK